MRGKELEDRPVSRHIANATTQAIRRQAGKIEETSGSLFVRQDPAKRGQRQRGRIRNRIFRPLENCQQSDKTIGNRTTSEGTEGSGGAMTKRILVVEDNDLNRKLFCDVLHAGGFFVEPVADGKLAIETARSFIPNLVVMDIQLQDVSGLDLIASLKGDADLADVPVLAVTAYAGKGDEERIREVGAEGYLAKPVSIGPFMATVKGLVGA